MMYEIGECMKVNNFKHCFHWIRKKYNSVPRIMFDFNIKKYIEKNNLQCEYVDIYDHVYESKKIESDDKVNYGYKRDISFVHYVDPKFKYLSNDDKNYILSKQPELNDLPIVPYIGARHRPVINYKPNISFEKLGKYLLEMISADCWGVYTKNKHDTPIKIYFDSRNDKDNIGFNRDNFFNEEYMKNFINESYETSLTICVVLGCTNFYDVYCYPSNNYSFNIVKVDYKYGNLWNDYYNDK